MVSNYLLKLKSQVKYVKLKESPEFLVTSAEILSLFKWIKIYRGNFIVFSSKSFKKY